MKGRSFMLHKNLVIDIFFHNDKYNRMFFDHCDITMSERKHYTYIWSDKKDKLFLIDSGYEIESWIKMNQNKIKTLFVFQIYV